MKWLRFKAFVGCRSGSVATIFTFALPATFLAIGLSVDGSNLLAQHSKVQVAADLAALSAAKEVRLANSDATVIQEVATNFVGHTIQGSSREQGSVLAFLTDQAEVVKVATLQWQLSQKTKVYRPSVTMRKPSPAKLRLG